MQNHTLKSSKFFPRVIAFCVLIGLLWTNAASYYTWMMDKSCCIAAEFCDPMDGENEKEMEEKLDDKVRTISSLSQIQTASLAGKHAYSIYYLYSLYHPEIVTPPPERNSVIA